MIDIKSISSETLFSVLITEEAEHVEELMKSDHVILSWNSELDYILPAGAYIEYKGEKYSLLEPYRPIQENENKFVFTPEFQSVIMRWAKIPFFMYTYAADNVITSREPDWSLTDTPANFMSVICKAIKNETGETWTFSVDASLPASATVSFQSTDIFSGLNAVANIFKTEWWADKANRILHLSKAEYGIPVTLEVGENINVPSVTDKKKGYYTRFYAFGSTRNIVQDYKEANVNNIANKRLTLDPTKYPGGYKDIKPGLQKGEIFSKILVFDDVYPSSKLTISDVRVRLMWSLGDDNEKVQIGTDEAGNPVYDQYAIWYFRIQGFTLNNTTYDKDSNPDGMLIPGKELSAHFETGALQGREFELIYHDKTETVSSADGTSIILNAGDYEIKFKEESTYIIPAITALIPSDGDKVILFNIRMPQEYVNSAYLELEKELDDEMERLSSDLNNYEFDSNPVAFYENNPNLSVGQKVTYINGDYSYSTRVIKLVTRLDYDIRQRITIGNDKITGTIQELKEDVSSANKDVNLLAEINNMTSSLQQSYQRTQKLMQEGFAAIKNMWRFDPDTPNTIYSIYNVYSLGAVSALGLSKGGSSGGGGASYSRLDNWSDYTADKAGYVLSAALGYDLKTRIDNLPTTSVNPYALTFGGKTYDGSQAVTLTAADLGALTTHQIIYSLTIRKNGTAVGTYSPASKTATINISDVASAATLSSHTDNSTIHITAAERTKWNTTSSSLDSIMGTDSDTIINKWEEVVAFLDTYTEADTLAGLLSNKADKTIKISAGQGLSGGGDLSDNRTLSLNTASATALGGIKVGDTLAIASEVLNLKSDIVTAGTYTKVTVDTYGRVTSGTTLIANDIPALSISKITGLQAELDKKLNKADFATQFATEMSKWFVRDLANRGIYPAEYDGEDVGFYSKTYVSALGVGSGGSGSSGGASYSRLDNWSDYTAAKAGYVLSAKLGYDLKTQIDNLPTTSVNPYALTFGSKTYDGSAAVSLTAADLGALTAHQPLDYLNIKDVRGETRLPSYFADKKLTVWFNNTGMPSSNWFSGIHMRGWTGSYASWELASTADDSNSIQDLYFRVGRSDTWQSWQTVLTSLNTKISNGVITINGTSITPLTTHQSVSDKAATLAWDSAVTIATVGSTNITVKLPANPNTDTKNTAGSTDTSSKLFLIGATSQAANPQTYSHDTAYIGTDGCLYSGGAKVLTSHQSLANYVTLNSAQTITGLKTFTQSVHLKHTNYSTGGNAKMIVFDDYQDNAVGSFGSLASNNVFQYIYAGWGTTPWNLPYCLAISSDRFTYKNNDVLHVGNYTDTLDTRYALKSFAMTFTDGTNYVAAKFNNASLALLAHNTYIEFWQSNAGWFNLKAGKFMVDGGTSSHFLKGDGSLDNNSYATTSQLTDGSVTKIGTQHVGSVSKGIYLNAGVPTAMTHSLAATVNAGTAGRLTYYSSTTAIAAYSSTVGGAARPMYLNAGVPTGLSENVGHAAKPIFLSAGTLTACSSTVGGVAKPVYLNAGEITACSSTVGSTSLPVFMSAGTVTPCGTSLAVSITGNAASATYASNVRISTLNPTSKTVYNLPFTTGISSGTNYPLYGNNGIRYQTIEGTTGSLGIAELLLGNNTTSGTAGNKYGAIRLYATTDGYTSYRTYNAAGRTLYLVGTANSVAVGSSLKPVYVSSAGVVTAFSNTIGSATTPVYVNAGTITNCSYSFGNNSGNVPISNGTLNTNLNANYLNGLEESRFFLTNRGTIPTAFVDLTTSTSGNANYANYSSGTYSIQSSSSTELFINFALNTGSTSALQLKTDYSTASTLYYRKTIDANRVSGDWSHFITSENIASQTVSKANSLVTARTIWGQSFNGSANVSGALSNVGNITPAANATYSCGTAASRWSSVYASNYLYVGAAGLTSPNSGVSGCVLSSEGCLELIGGKYAYIDFHYDGSKSDYTNRIIEGVSGQLTVTGSLRIGLAYATSSSYKFYVAGTAYISSTLKVASTADYASSSAAFSTTGSIFASKNIYAAGAVTAKASSSDIRLKKDLCEYDALDMIRSFRSVKYKWNDVAKRNSEVFNTDAWQFGLIAQDLIKGGYRQLTSDVFKDYLTIQYERLTPVLWRGVQQIDEEITQLKKRIEELEKKAKTNTRFTKTNIRYK